MAETAVTGKQGEEIAVRYLKELGYEIRERNVRLQRYEIDVVAFDRRRKMMVFVEVKARSHLSPAYPIRTAVDQRKRRALREAVARWVTAHKYEGPGRIDIVSVGKGSVVEHIMDLGSDFF
jgi:putative endonuclease